MRWRHKDESDLVPALTEGQVRRETSPKPEHCGYMRNTLTEVNTDVGAHLVNPL